MTITESALFSCLVLFGASAALAAVAPAGPADSSPVFEIPRLASIVIDGKPDDWGDAGFRVEMLAPIRGRAKPMSDLDCRFRLGWDDRGLLVLLTVHDDSFVENDDEGWLWQNDCVELYMVDRRGGKELIQAVIAPGMDVKHPELRYHLYDHRKDEALKKVKLSLTAARTRIDGGYVMEVLLPWQNVGIKPRAGVEVGFQVFVDDFDKQAGLYHAVWYPAVGTFMDTTRAHRLRLSDKAGAPVLAAGRGSYDGMKCTRATVLGVRELAGKGATVLADGKEIARGTLAESAGRASVDLTGPLPPFGTDWKKLDILVEGEVIQTLSLPDMTEVRARALMKADVGFGAYCFAGKKLPDCGFEDLTEAGNILGPHTVKVTYYGADFRPVSSADKPGRYGAIVEIGRESGPVINRFHTLFRSAGPVDWRKIRLAPKIALPKELGVDPAVVRQQAETLKRLQDRLAAGSAAAALLKEWGINPAVGKEQAEAVEAYASGRFANTFVHSSDSAIVLAWLRETAPGTHTAKRNDPWSCNTKWIHELKRKTGNLVPLKYVVHLPQGAEKDKTRKWPTIIHLHGGGNRSEDTEWLKNNPVTKYLKTQKDSPFLVIAPMSPPGQWWQVPSLDDLYEEIVAKYPVDTDRVYLTGLSMGGYGSWTWLAACPGRFAAVVPICGGGDPQDVERLKDVPIWVFHGAKDPSVPVQRSYEMVEALRKVHGRVRLTVYPEGAHTIWDRTYSTDELYDWMLRQVRGKPQHPPATAQGKRPSD